MAAKTKSNPAQSATKSTPSNSNAHSKPSAAPTSATRTPSHDEVALRAYFLFEERGFVHGFNDEDWVRAEKELSSRVQA